ncbi:hypothetical protein Glove_213g112 [Diversispora epigaea]|uniref:Protein kinase domain-containing protein n=1 Tax=Diversispora epigaea TaxID=1348612 RepID=A0A397IR90_9GLOM|nr:hypothetical protein Glove_213g112 [Diversispora epigaea]
MNIDSFIKRTQSPNNRTYDPHLIWVPFEEFKGVKKIGQGGFSQIFKATWKIQSDINYDGNVKRSSKQEIVLKVLNNSQNVDTEFLNELKRTFQLSGCIIKCQGVTQDPQTKNYALVLEYARNEDLHHFIHKLLHGVRRRINNSHICYYCYGVNSLVANSGNMNIDSFIKRTQSPNNRTYDPHLIWVPFEEFKGVKKIGQGGFSQIFKATWKIQSDINYDGNVKRSSKQEIVLKVLNNSQNVDTEFLNELKRTFQLSGCIIKCQGVTQDPQTKNYALVLEYARNEDLHHFIHKLLHGVDNILVNNNYRYYNYGNYPIISDLGFSQPASIDSNLSRESQIYGIIPYMAPELFKNQSYSYATDIYSFGMIM